MEANIADKSCSLFTFAAANNSTAQRRAQVSQVNVMAKGGSSSVVPAQAASIDQAARYEQQFIGSFKPAASVVQTNLPKDVLASATIASKKNLYAEQFRSDSGVKQSSQPLGQNIKATELKYE